MVLLSGGWGKQTDKGESVQGVGLCERKVLWASASSSRWITNVWILCVFPFIAVAAQAVVEVLPAA